MIQVKISRKKVGMILLCCFASFCFAQSAGESQFTVYTPAQQKLRITAEDVRIIPEPDAQKGGYHLYVRKLPDVQSILLTETTKDPNGVNDSFAYRAKEYNPINGDEIRYLDGKPLISQTARYSLIDSTVENTDFFGPAFHIYIPEVIVYGYPWSRYGEVTVGKGTFINIRSFSKPYADYSGEFMDSPFMFDLRRARRKPRPAAQKPKPEPSEEKPQEVPPPKEDLPEASDEKPEAEEVETILTDDYNPIASDKFKEISEKMIYSKGPENLPDDICAILDEIDDKSNLDVVFAIDATGSMKNDIEKLKTDLNPLIKEKFRDAQGARFGLLFYRDYGDTFYYKGLPVKMYSFTTNLDSFNKNLNAIKINGKEGGDIPEAVYEAIYASCEFYVWRKDAAKLVILIGDAEPHPTPRKSGKYSKDFVMNVAAEKGIKIRSILLPKD